MSKKPDEFDTEIAKKDIQENGEESPSNGETGSKKGKIIKRVTIALLIAAAIVAIIMAISSHRKTLDHMNKEKFDQAVEMVMNGNWKGAIETFESLSQSNYKGARDFYLYCKGKQQYAEGDLKAAYKTVGQTMLKDLTEEQREFIQDYFFELDHEYHRKYGYDLPTENKPSSNNSSSSSGMGNHPHSSGSNSSSKTDPYNAKDYANEDDFWEDYYNDFIDFDEAEQYWDEHHK